MSFVQALVGTYKYLFNNNMLAGLPNTLDIARDKIGYARPAQVEGFAQDLPTGARDISELDVDIIPTPPLSGTQMSLKSTSANDTINGSNSRKVTIEYIEPVTELLKNVEYELNGTATVNITEQIAFVSDFYVSESADLDSVSAGDITIFNTATPTTIYNVIKAGGNKSLSAYRYIPKGRDLYISAISVSGDTKGINVRLRANQTDNYTTTTGFLFKGIAIMAESPTEIIYDPPIVITGQHYVKFTAFTPTGTSGGKIAVGINGWLEISSPRRANG